jgi:hypothetical protein
MRVCAIEQRQAHPVTDEVRIVQTIVALLDS